MGKKRIIIFLFAIGLCLSGCGLLLAPDSLTAPASTQPAAPASAAISEPTPARAATSTQEPAPTPFPVNQETLDDLIVLTKSNAGFFEQVAELWTANLFVSSMAYYPGKSLIALGTGSSYITSDRGFLGLRGKTKIILWNPRSNTVQDAFKTGAHDIAFNSIAVSPDGHWIAFVGTDRLVLGEFIGETAEGNLTFTSQTISIDEIKNPNPDLGIVFSPDSRLLAIANAVGDILIWDVQASTRQAFFTMGNRIDQGYEIPNCLINAKSIAFTPDGSTLLSSCESDVLSWDIDTLQHTPIPNIIGNTSVFALSPAGDILVTGTLDGGLFVWQYPSGEKQADLPGHPLQINSLAFNHDGSLLASSSQDGTIELWDTQTWERLTTVQALADFLTFSPDDQSLVVGTHHQGGTLWGVRSGGSTAQRSGVKIIISEGGTPLTDWLTAIPSEWLSAAGTFPRFEVQVISSWSSVEDCRYLVNGSQRFVFRRTSNVSVRITDLETGIIVAENNFSGSTPDECPETKRFSQNSFVDYINGSDPDIQPFLPWLKEILAPYGY